MEPYIPERKYRVVFPCDHGSTDFWIAGVSETYTRDELEKKIANIKAQGCTFKGIIDSNGAPSEPCKEFKDWVDSI